MDPNANLAEQERLLTYDDPTLRVIFGGSTLTQTHRRMAARLIDLRQALYDWIRDGGFEPDWNLAPNARKYYGR
jgi:hypothetical protein